MVLCFCFSENHVIDEEVLLVKKVLNKKIRDLRDI